MTGATFLTYVAIFFAIAIVIGLLASRRLDQINRHKAFESSLDFVGMAFFFAVTVYACPVLS